MKKPEVESDQHLEVKNDRRVQNARMAWIHTLEASGAFSALEIAEMISYLDEKPTNDKRT